MRERETGERIQSDWRERGRGDTDQRERGRPTRGRDTEQREGATNERGRFGVNGLEERKSLMERLTEILTYGSYSNFTLSKINACD